MHLLRPPETLHDTPGSRLSHGGLLDTPAGLFTVLALEHRPVPPLAGSALPWLVYLTLPGNSHGTLALPAIRNDPEYGVEFVICRFGPVPDRGGLMLVIRHAFLPRQVGLSLDAPAVPSAQAVLLAEPALVGAAGSGDVRVWHSGVLRVGGLLHTHLEATAERPGLLAGPDWDVSPNRPPGTPRPVEVRAEPVGSYRGGTGQTGEQHSGVDALLTVPESDLRLSWTCHPLGITGTSVIPAS
ncbi:hypothetical protein ABZW30_35335 [Kitasatospora sp. NPDC004669]|uniref:hypothetical protein n=1 Tax=Kitasatospora sp. NPDC004669 TaxID=3154555 RepID=UPI00339E3DBD